MLFFFFLFFVSIFCVSDITSRTCNCHQALVMNFYFVILNHLDWQYHYHDDCHQFHFRYQTYLSFYDIFFYFLSIVKIVSSIFDYCCCFWLFSTLKFTKYQLIWFFFQFVFFFLERKIKLTGCD